MTETVEALQARINALEAELAAYRAAEQLTQARLKRFDDLDFVAYSQGIPNNDFGLFNEIHTEDVKVYNGGELEPITTTIKDHDEAMLPYFQIFPDLKVVAHPIAFGQGDWTCVIGVSEGTFTGTMIGPDGNPIPSTGKRFRSTMVTVAKWEGQRISEEYLFVPMDNIMKQIGLA
jgi:hypothetical protein